MAVPWLVLKWSDCIFEKRLISFSALKDASDEELMQKVDELISELTGMKLGGNMMGGSAGAEEEDSEEESEVSEEE